MKKLKFMLVTAIMLIMFAAIYGGLFLLYQRGYIFFTCLLTAYGLLRGTLDFYYWLSEDAPEKPEAEELAEEEPQIEKHDPVFFTMREENK